MNRTETTARIKSQGVLPILRTPTADDALALADVLFRAGMSCIEIPLTVPGALEVIEELARGAAGSGGTANSANSGNWEGLVVGAGSVLTPADAGECLAAGARFIVSPGVNLATITFCVERGLAVIPGALTPTEIASAWHAGADAIKVFPASALGGPSYIRALRGPFPTIELIPTGGVNLDNAAAYFEAGAVAVGVGGDLADSEALHAGRAAAIAERARSYLSLVALAR